MLEIMTVMKGFVVGAFMLVPGVSGGTMCMVFKVYDRLIESVSRFTDNVKKNFFFLVQFVLGAGVAFLLLSKVVTGLNIAFPKEVAFFVMGAIAAGLPVIYKEAKVEKLSPKVLFYGALGLLIVFLFTRLPKNLFTVTDLNLVTVIIQIFAGVLGALGLILPGISFSAMLYMMGVYNFIYGAIGDRNFLVLIPFGIGMLLGVILLTRILELAMKKHPTPTYLVIIGFVIGSIGDIIKEMNGLPKGSQWVVCIVTFIVGFVSIYLMGKWEERKTKNEI